MIPKSNNQRRLVQNLDVTSWNLDDSEVNDINGLDKGLRFNDPLHVRTMGFCLHEKITNVFCF